ncbi:MAG: hypothetical protein RBT49_06295 [Bacteroidales bacterium]|jgi:hypothetical protein|nr:hypothetical protein [Bacteroidales bacterium]
MKQYTFELIIKEGNDEFWEELIEKDETGCDLVYVLLKNCIEKDGFDCELKLKRFEDQ